MNKLAKFYRAHRRGAIPENFVAPFRGHLRKCPLCKNSIGGCVAKDVMEMWVILHDQQHEMDDKKFRANLNFVKRISLLVALTTAAGKEATKQ